MGAHVPELLTHRMVEPPIAWTCRRVTLPTSAAGIGGENFLAAQTLIRRKGEGGRNNNEGQTELNDLHGSYDD